MLHWRSLPHAQAAAPAPPPAAPPPPCHHVGAQAAIMAPTCHHVGAQAAGDLGVGEAALLDLPHVLGAQVGQLLGLQPQLGLVQLTQLRDRWGWERWWGVKRVPQLGAERHTQ